MNIKLKLTHKCDTCGRKDKQFVSSSTYTKAADLIEDIDFKLPRGWSVKNNGEIQCDICTLKEPQVQ